MADQGVDLIVTSGGLGPTADDLTVEMVARFSGRPLVLDDGRSRTKIAEILKPLMAPLRATSTSTPCVAANRKQALVPEGATMIDPAGTAPGLVVPPGRPRRPHGRGAAGPAARAAARCGRRRWRPTRSRHAIAGRTVYEQRMLRLFGIPESEIAETLRVAEDAVERLRRLEITTCLRRGEVEVVDPLRAGRRGAVDGDRGADRASATRARSSRATARASTIRWRSCWRGAGWRPRSRARAACWPARLTERPGVVRLRGGRRRVLLERGEERPAGRGPGADRGATARCRPRWPRRWPTARCERFGADMAVSITGRRRARTAAPRRSRSATSAGA